MSKVLAKTIMNSLARWGLSLSNLRGQCYDGASNMAGARSVVVPSYNRKLLWLYIITVQHIH